MLGITLGDPNGVGPEILIKTVLAGALPAPYIVYGDRAVLEYAAGSLGAAIEIVSVKSPEMVSEDLDDQQIPLVDCTSLPKDSITPGSVSAEAGRAALVYIKKATLDALATKVDAVVTLPVNKKACRYTEPGFTGHTEYITSFCGDYPVTMMLVSDQLIVTHVSTHVSMQQAINAVKKPRILEVVRLTEQAVKKLRPDVKLAVAGLNPHAGESGAFGEEEIEHIIPALEAAREMGIPIAGPEPADTVFNRAIKNGEFNAVICMYHDQGHIPMKTLDFHGGVNVTLGLPIIRTSVDHGTAYDIAYQNIASTESFMNACSLAVKLAAN